MVHRKSEYRLQYNFLPENIRKQIWEDNANLRSCRKVVNQAHHYWEYQITDKYQCDCDGEEEYDPGPPPPHKLKHKTLLEQYGNKALTKSKSCVNFDERSRNREIAVQTPNWKGRKDSGSDSGRESGGSEELQEVMRNMSSLSLPEVPQNPSPSSNRPKSPIPPPTPVVGSASVPRCRSRSQSRPPSVSQHRSLPPRSRTPCPTRTSKRLYSEGKKTHFVPFGWNNSEPEIGKKKTFNVCAPAKEVYRPAVDASRRKHNEIQKFISEDMAKNKHRLKTLVPHVNSANIWTSEYKEQFCKNRPTSASYHPS